MDFVILLAKGIGTTVGVGLFIIILGSLLLRKAQNNSRMALGPAAISLGFAAGFLVFWGWPGFWPTEAWQMTVIAALAAGLLVTPAMMLRSIARWTLLLVSIALITGLIVRTKLTPLSLFLPSIAGAMLLYLAALRPSIKAPRLWLTATGPMFLSAFAAVLAIMLYVDQNTGRMMILLCALTGMLIGAGAIRPFRDAGRGGTEFLALLFAPILALAAFYNYALPNTVFILLALAPLGSAAAWIPALKKRPWTCAFLAILVTLAIVAPALWIAVKNAPALE
jgi:hypothetical protein